MSAKPTEKRWCLRCGREKGIAEFRPDETRPKRGVVNHCRPCEGLPAKRKPPAQPPAARKDGAYKRCRRCKEYHTWADFRTEANPLALSDRCSTCRAELSRQAVLRRQRLRTKRRLGT
jgi:hypothetical protein